MPGRLRPTYWTSKLWLLLVCYVLHSSACLTLGCVSAAVYEQLFVQTTKIKYKEKERILPAKCFYMPEKHCWTSIEFSRKWLNSPRVKMHEIILIFELLLWLLRPDWNSCHSNDLNWSLLFTQSWFTKYQDGSNALAHFTPVLLHSPFLYI